ncbi:hypothetical protein VIOR3934_01638 [Vibrio orientalis CIP 102891 = ATCC 33934]|uniref:DUF3306 domain-containing protein n=1 Tax=Vibrio orientalis CIP 102891 = ATCC 33934 TaxID=675816 RepID=C9QKP1_VIBOR|nr:DUF3306 domain-containing protein [Vibrio orientalis]EEX92376.1 hypothetical protein VIA_003021 [Vibrio orientalis CIP 102891 = ATCC 33934]EGU51799.1 hypothetical protein VIOR3934_01638 [Vibrio orientalis CIP 102891 = ATCC 33934]
MATSFLSRWSKRKLEGDEAEQQSEIVESDESATPTAEPIESVDESPVAELTEHIEPIESEQSEVSVAALLASEAESAVKKAALRKLFLSGEFSAVDGLNDYDHDYKAVKSLSTEVASKLRDWMNADDEQEEQVIEESLVQNEDQADDEIEQAPITNDDLIDEQHQQVGQNIPHKK